MSKISTEELERIASDFENHGLCNEFGMADTYAMARELLAARKVVETMRWVHDGAHTGGHTLPDIKEAAHYSLADYDAAVGGTVMGQPGAIVLVCYECEVRVETPRCDADPTDATEIRGVRCPNCDNGGFDMPAYYDINGNEVSGEPEILKASMEDD